MSPNNQLADRIEKATGPDRELDELICAAVAGAVREVQSDGRVAYHTDNGKRWTNVTVQPVTASLDAAMTLVPEGEFVCVDGPRKYLNIPTPVPNYWRACIGYAPEHRGWGETPALALCAAALRARQS